MDILKACGLRKIYGSGETAVHALDGVDLTVEKGEFVAIVGTSGSPSLSFPKSLFMILKYRKFVRDLAQVNIDLIILA